ncbi:MAG: mercury transporter MerT, partial [Devosia sp.]|nr:mercury transporter MerT [Devosia sp.]
ALERQGSADNGARRKRTLLAAGGVVGAVLASACCVLPLALVTLGVSGAWIGSLTLLDPYQAYIAVVALGLIGAGFWQVYFKPRPVDECGPDGYCARPESTVITQAVLWIATALVLLALTIGWWAPFLY